KTPTALAAPQCLARAHVPEANLSRAVPRGQDLTTGGDGHGLDGVHDALLLRGELPRFLERGHVQQAADAVTPPGIGRLAAGHREGAAVGREGAGGKEWALLCPPPRLPPARGRVP